MKKGNSKTVMILLPVVLSIWGLILYKVFFNKPENIFRDEIEHYKSDEWFSVKKDTFELFLDYPNPFGISKLSSTQVSGKEKKAHKTIRKKPQKKVRWPKINYIGTIEQSNSSKKITVLNIDGLDVLFDESLVHDEVNLVSSTRDSVIVSYKEVEKTIYK